MGEQYAIIVPLTDRRALALFTAQALDMGWTRKEAHDSWNAWMVEHDDKVRADLLAESDNPLASQPRISP